MNIRVTEHLKPDVSTACPASPPPASPPPSTASTPAPQFSQLLWLWPVLGSSLGLIVGLVLVLQCGAGKQNGGSEETTCCELLVSHELKRPIRNKQEFYSTVCYFLITQNVADPAS
ncbi:hypothetical protein NL108_018383 [Boleophthalmus pectinirostris]|nr:hypothetical protein NL108_018383 [Boleophthalmus pectinirostris]